MIAKFFVFVGTMLAVIVVLGVVSYRNRKRMDEVEKKQNVKLDTAMRSLNHKRDTGGRVVAIRRAR